VPTQRITTSQTGNSMIGYVPAGRWGIFAAHIQTNNAYFYALWQEYAAPRPQE